MRAFCLVCVALLELGCGGSSFSAAGSSGSSAGGAAGAAAAGGSSVGGASGSTGQGGTSSAGKGGASSAGQGGSTGVSGSGTAGVSGGTAGVSGTAGAGATAGSGTGGVSGAAGAAGTSGTAGAPATICPVMGPPQGTCKTGLTCSYGDDIRAQCRTVAQCAAGHFIVGAPGCKSLIACSAVVGSPFQLHAVCGTRGDDCLLSSDPTYGPTYCRCDSCTGPDCAGPLIWDCLGSPSKPCPLTVPNEGQSCSGAAPSCTYGNCDMEDQLEVDCVNGFWQWAPLACASVPSP
ncbi:MAG TPA: hypothetical protein VGI10_17960 [Polyangiaceae bacterium]|jgi:hypothetical protein